MKTFVEYLTEAKDRFINKNRNLTDDQKKEIIKFFKTTRQAERLIDWNNYRKLTYDDFLNIMVKFRSGRKTKLRHKNISGLKEGVDYINIVMKTKKFLAYAIMNYEASKIIASDRVGPCRGTWCTAHSDSPGHWNEYAIDNNDVFVYVMNTEEKWAVQIDEDNRTYEVWDYHDVPINDIPGFDVKKELLTSKLKKMYDEIREQYEHEEHGPPEEYDDAVQEYRDLVHDIEEAHGEYEEGRDNYYRRISSIMSDTLEHYDTLLSEVEDEMNDIQEKIDALESDMEDLDDDINDLEENGEDAGKEKRFLEANKKHMITLEKEMKEAEEEYDRLSGERGEVEATEEYEFTEMSFNQDLDWQGDVPESEYEYEEDINWVDPFSGGYSTYIGFAENYMGVYLNGKAKEEIRSDVNMYILEGGYREDAADVLSKHELTEPYWESY